LGKLNAIPKATGTAGGRGQGAQSSNRQQQRSSKPSQPREKKKPHEKTAEELDAEMDTYMGDVSIFFLCFVSILIEYEDDCIEKETKAN